MYQYFASMLKAKFFPKCSFVGSAIGITKPGKDKPRPICIPEAFDKLLAKIILHLEDDAYKRSIPETQNGVRK